MARDERLAATAVTVDTRYRDDAPPPSVTGAVEQTAMLLRELSHKARTFNVFKLLWLIERSRADAAPLGVDGPLSQEPVRLLAHTGIGFPAQEVAALAWPDDGDDEAGEVPDLPPDLISGLAPELRLTFMGLYGVDSPLPAYFQQDIACDATGADALAAFLDIFNHRLYAYFYRAWKRYRYQYAFDEQGGDAISHYLLSLFGLGLGQREQRLTTPPAMLLPYAGLFSQRVRNPESLRTMLAHFLRGAPVAIAGWQPVWIEAGSCVDSRLGSSLQLGHNSLLGRRGIDYTRKCRIAIGPLDAAQYRDCLPTGKEFPALLELIELFLGDAYQFDLRLLVRRGDMPAMCLQGAATNGDDDAADGVAPSALGWTTACGAGDAASVLSVVIDPAAARDRGGLQCQR